MARKTKTQRTGPARSYRRSPKRYEAARNVPSQGLITRATRMGCRDAVKGRKNPYKPEVGGAVSAYREGYRICDAIYAGRERLLTTEQKRVAQKLHLESEIQFTPIGGSRRRRKKSR